MREWKVASLEPNRVTLSYRHTANAYWPFEMACTQPIHLADDFARFEVSICNLGICAMPAGLGFHPRFALAPDTLVTLDATSIWLQDSAGCPTRLAPVKEHGQFDYRVPRPAQTVVLNHCFAGWTEVAQLDFVGQQFSVCLSASLDLRHLVVFRQPDQPWLCIEPASHATGALSLGALASGIHGARVLQPGQHFTGHMEISLSDHSLG